MPPLGDEMEIIMNMYKKSKKVMSVIICLCVVMQLIFRSFCFDAMANSSNILVALIFRDDAGYHIRKFTSFINADGTLTLPAPMDLGDTDEERYSKWSPVLVENSFDNVKRVIRNGGHLNVEEYDISNPPTLATPSAATPSTATSSTDDGVVVSGFAALNDEESARTDITLYKSNVIYNIGSTIHIARPNRINAVTDGMIQFISKNGNKDQIFFLAVQPQVILHIDIPHEPELPSTEEPAHKAKSPQAEDKSHEPATENPTVENHRSNIEETGSRTDIIVPSASANPSGHDHGTSRSDNVIADANTTKAHDPQAEVSSQDTNTSNQNSIVDTKSTETTQTNIFAPMGSGNNHNSENGRLSHSRPNPVVNIQADTVNNKNNDFLNTKSTSVTVSDGNFDPKNYFVSVYKTVDGKEVPSDAKYNWSSNRDKHVVTIMFDDDGEYRISVTKKNSGSTAVTGRAGFERKIHIDSTAPSITISGVENLTANARTVSPVVRYSDDNIDLSKSTVTLTSVADGKVKELLYKAVKQDSSYILNLDPIYIDDNYVLTVKIYDLAGNFTEKSVNFSVNKKGATFKFKPEELVGQYTNRPFYPIIEVWNTDEISIVSATVNGMDEPYEFVDGELRFSNPIDKDGKYVFNLEVSDTAGNKSSMKPVELIYDAAKPVTIISGAADGESYEGGVKVVVSTELPGDIIESIWLNKKLLDKSEYVTRKDGTAELNIMEAGEYTLEAQSKDQAGNLSDITAVNFDIKTPNKILAGYMPWAVIILGFALALGLAAVRYKQYKKNENTSE